MLSHAQALLTSTPEGACAYIDADIRDTGKILKDAANLLDFGRPVAVCLIMILQFIPDEDDPPRSCGRWSTPCRPAVTWRSRTPPATLTSTWARPCAS